MTRRIISIVALFAFVATAGALSGCKSPAEKCAAAAKACIDKAKDESVDELTNECQKGLDDDKEWAKKASTCYDEHGSDCDALNKCMGE